MTNIKWGIASNRENHQKSNLRLLHKSNLDAEHKCSAQLLPQLQSQQICFTLQIRSPRLPEEAGCHQNFSWFGNIRFLRYKPDCSFGFVCFQLANAVSLANNLLLPITTFQVKCAFSSTAGIKNCSLVCTNFAKTGTSSVQDLWLKVQNCWS